MTKRLLLKFVGVVGLILDTKTAHPNTLKNFGMNG